MSFYDDASLVFLPSGGAGKDGKAYSIKPVPEYGTELITNGGFNTDSDWNFTNAGGSNGWRIADGRAICDTVNPSSGRNLNSSISLVSGKSYKVTLDILQSADELEILIGGTLIENAFPIGTTIGASYIIDSSQHSGGIFSFYGGSSDLQEIDNVSVREVIVDGDFTFSRGSNLTATRVDSNGLIEKGRENLLLQSNQFDTTWLNVGTAETSGQSGYDGTNNAWLLDTTSDGTNRRIYQSVSLNSVQTFSFYAKAGTSEWCYVNIIQSATNANNYYHLSGVGSKGASPSVSIINETIESVGNGWYRISITGDLDTSEVRIQIANGDGDSSAVVGDNIYIQDAQLEIGLVATEYIESGATKGKAGLLEQEPRFDYSGGASCPSLLLEPSRTNLVTQSEYLNGISWNAFINSSIDTNATTSPEGLTNASLLKENLLNDTHAVIDDFSLTSGSTYTISIFAKSNGVNRNLRLNDGGVGWGSGFTGKFDLTAGTATGGDIESMGNGWYRCSVTGTTNATTSRLIIYSTLGTATSYQGDGSSGVFLYGLQIEEGSLTSYIPNHSGGSVTRDADKKYLQNSSVLSSGSGTILWEIGNYNTNTSPAGFNQIITISKNSDTSLNDIIYLDEYQGTNKIYVRKNNVLILASSAYEDLRNSKIAVSWDSNGAKIFIDGVENASYVGDASNTFEFFGHDRPYNDAIVSTLKLKQELYFPSALSTADLEILTGATSYESFSAMATALNYTTYE